MEWYAESEAYHIDLPIIAITPSKIAYDALIINEIIVDIVIRKP